MEKRLWRVRVEFEFYALSETAAGAQTHAREAFSDLSPYDADADEVDAKWLNSDWANAEPYGSDGRTCEQILGIDAETLAEKARVAAERAAWEAHPSLPFCAVEGASHGKCIP